MKPKPIKHFENRIELTIKIPISYQFYIRKWIGIQLIRLAARIMCLHIITIEDNREQREK